MVSLWLFIPIIPLLHVFIMRPVDDPPRKYGILERFAGPGAGPGEESFRFHFVDKQIERLEKIKREQDPVREWERAWGQSVHSHSDQIRRQERSHYQSSPTSLERGSHVAVFQGLGDVYRTSFFHCSCPDFAKRQLPYKHMYRLAREFRIFF